MSNNMVWQISHRFDPDAASLADRHYSRQKVGSPQFVPPGRCAVFLSKCKRAYWVTSWQYPEYVKHAWKEAWVCSAFRSEGAGKASDLILQAISATMWHFQNDEVPELGMITFVDRDKVKPTFVRGAREWGFSFKKAGFVEEGETKSGLLVLRLKKEMFPTPVQPIWRLM